MTPTYQPRIPPHRRQRRGVIPAPVPTGTIVVLGVGVAGDNVLTWEFSQGVLSAGENCPQLECNGAGDWEGPDFVEIVGGQVWATYGGTSFYSNPGQWRIIAEPVGLVFASDTVAVPQSGDVLGP